MPEQTQNYDLIKQLPDEFYNRELDNQNLDLIDALIKALQDSKANGTDLTSLSNTLNQHFAAINPHSETENRAISVGNTHEFKTIQGAINSIKKNLGGKGVLIVVDAGYSTMETVEINGFHNGEVSIHGNGAQIHRLIIQNSSGGISVNKLVINSTDKASPGVYIRSCNNVEVSEIEDIKVRDSHGVLVSLSSNIFIRSSTFRNKFAFINGGASIISETHNTLGNNKHALHIGWGAVVFANSNYTGTATISEVNSWDGGKVIK